MSEIIARLKGDLNTARRAQEKPAVLLLSTILSDLKNRSIELRRELDDDEAADVLRKGIKRRRESVEMYAQAGREELAARERLEISALEEYLPPPVEDSEIRAAVVAAIDGGASNIGAVIGTVVPLFKGRADGSRVSAIVREELASRG